MNSIGPFLAPYYPLLSPEEFFQKIERLPVRQTPTGTFGELFIEIVRLVNGCFIPLSYHYVIYLRVMSCLTLRYGSWDIKDFVKSQNNLFERALNEQDITPVLGFPLIGASGNGKTSILNHVMGLFPKVIIHKTLGIKQVTVVSIDCPTKGSIRQLCLNFLVALGKIVGEDYGKQYRRENEDEIYTQLTFKAGIHCLGLLVVDEIHNLQPVKWEARLRVINQLKELTNRVKVPIVYIGTDQAIPILFSDYQTGSRAQGFGIPVLNAFNKDDKDWIRFMKGLWSVQIFENIDELTQDIHDAYFEESQGIIRQAKVVHAKAQELALYGNLYKITPEIIRQTRVHLSGTKKVIDTMNSNDSISKSQIQGVNVNLGKKRRVQSNGYIINEEERKEYLKIAKKDYPQINANVAMAIIDQVLQDFYELDRERRKEFLYSSLDRFLYEDENTDSNSTPRVPNGDLIDICVNAQTDQDNYELLLQSGLIVDVNKVLSF